MRRLRCVLCRSTVKAADALQRLERQSIDLALRGLPFREVVHRGSSPRKAAIFVNIHNHRGCGTAPCLQSVQSVQACRHFEIQKARQHQQQVLTRSLDPSFSFCNEGIPSIANNWYHGRSSASPKRCTRLKGKFPFRELARQRFWQASRPKGLP